MLFRPRVVSGVECNSKEPKFEVDSHVDTNTTCLGSGALKIFQGVKIVSVVDTETGIMLCGCEVPLSGPWRRVLH